jgi:hypothetical protein
MAMMAITTRSSINVNPLRRSVAARVEVIFIVVLESANDWV